jgi:citrate lyase subunit beta/citryl-CoA lyase
MYRSFLFVPATSPRFWAKAADRGADALILDLEDSVAPAEKERARDALKDAAQECGRGGAAIFVRVNRPLSLGVRDVEAAVEAGATGITIAKAESADHVRLLAEVAAEVEHRIGRTDPVRFICSIESPRALFNAREIADADPRVLGLTGGGEDFATELGAQPLPETLMVPKQMINIAAKAAGRYSFGMFGTVADYSDLEAIRARALEARRYGFSGASCIHPSVVPVLNESFAATAEELDEARELLAAFDEALGRGDGAFTHRGKMVDLPIIERARQLLASVRP